MKKLYVLVAQMDYQATDILGIFTAPDKARQALNRADKDDEYNDYDEISIVKFNADEYLTFDEMYDDIERLETIDRRPEEWEEEYEDDFEYVT